MAHNTERAHRVSSSALERSKRFSNRQKTNKPSDRVTGGPSFVAEFLYKIEVLNNDFVITECQTLPAQIFKISTEDPLWNSFIEIYNTPWLIEEIGNEANTKKNYKFRLMAPLKIDYDRQNDEIYFVEDIYNYESWALWDRNELVYSSNGNTKIYKTPSCKIEKLFDYFNETEISAVISGGALDVFPHPKFQKSTFLVAKILIKNGNYKVKYVKRFSTISKNKNP